MKGVTLLENNCTGEAMANRQNVVLGSIFVLLGLMFLSVTILDFDWEDLWPLFMLVGGVGFWIGYLSNRRNYGLLMPATLLLLYGSLFQYCALTDWDNMEYLWPTFVLGPGLGLLMMYVGGRRESGLLIPAAILTGLAAIFFVVFGPFQEYARYWPVLLILAGLALLLRRREEAPQ